MLLGQFLAVGLTAVKRFDAVVLHVWWSVRDGLKSVRSFWSGEADLG